MECGLASFVFRGLSRICPHPPTQSARSPMTSPTPLGRGGVGKEYAGNRRLLCICCICSPSPQRSGRGHRRPCRLGWGVRATPRGFSGLLLADTRHVQELRKIREQNRRANALTLCDRALPAMLNRIVLLRRLRNGDRPAFESVITAHYESVYRQLWYLCGDRDREADLT